MAENHEGNGLPPPNRTRSGEPTLIRNQQVSGSSPLVGSTHDHQRFLGLYIDELP